MNTNQPETVVITCPDRAQIKAEVFGLPGQTCVLINPAIGVRRRLYRPLAEYLSSQQITVVSYNYRGMEDGSDGLDKSMKQDVVAWGSLDQSAVTGWVLQNHKPKKLLLLGHSLGGQIVGFNQHLDQVSGLVHVASQKGDKRFWSLSGCLKLFLVWHVLIPWMSSGSSFNSRKLGLGTYPWPAPAARQWAAWGREKDYLFNPKFGFDLTPWRSFDQPILSLGFTDDPMAPEAAIDGLLSEFGSANNRSHISKRILDPKSVGLDNLSHFGFFKPEAKPLWPSLKTWIDQIK